MRNVIASFVALTVVVVAPAFAASPLNFEKATELASRPVVTDRQIGEIAEALDASAYAVLFNSEKAQSIQFGGGLMSIGENTGFIFTAGEALPSGVYWNHTTQPVFIGDGNGEPGFELPSGGLVVIGTATQLTNELTSANLIAESENPSVTCRAGYYACCRRNSGGSSRTAKCIQDGTTPAPTCDHGGPGAESCSFGGDVSAVALVESPAGGVALN